MSAVLITDYFIVSRGRWDLSTGGRSRWVMLVPWAAGFVTYQLINPGYVSWWVSAWTSFGRDISLHPGRLDVGLDPVLGRRRGGHPADGHADPLAQTLTQRPLGPRPRSLWLPSC